MDTALDCAKVQSKFICNFLVFVSAVMHLERYSEFRFKRVDHYGKLLEVEVTLRVGLCRSAVYDKLLDIFVEDSLFLDSSSVIIDEGVLHDCV